MFAYDIVSLRRMVTDASVCPLVVPLVHEGMQHILSVGSWVPLNAGKQLRVIVGDPIDFEPLIQQHVAQGKSARCVCHLSGLWGVLRHCYRHPWTEFLDNSR